MSVFPVRRAFGMECYCFEDGVGQPSAEHFMSCPFSEVLVHRPQSTRPYNDPLTVESFLHQPSVDSNIDEQVLTFSTTSGEGSPELDKLCLEVGSSSQSMGRNDAGLDRVLDNVYGAVFNTTAELRKPVEAVLGEPTLESTPGEGSNRVYLDIDPFDGLTQSIVMHGSRPELHGLVTLLKRGFKSQNTLRSGSFGDADALLISMRATLGLSDASVINFESDLELASKFHAESSPAIRSFLFDMLHMHHSLDTDDLANILLHYENLTNQSLRLGICETARIANHNRCAVYNIHTVRNVPQRDVRWRTTVWIVKNTAPIGETFKEAVVTGPSGREYGESQLSRWSGLAPDGLAVRPTYAAVAGGLPQAQKHPHSPACHAHFLRSSPRSPGSRGKQPVALHKPTARAKNRLPAAASSQPASGSGEFFCPEPGCKRNKRPLKSKRGLRVHVLKVHESDETDRRWPCREGCGDRFFFPKDERRHRRVHENGGGYFCPIASCNRSKANATRDMRFDNLKRHYESQHPEEQVPAFFATNSGTEM